MIWNDPKYVKAIEALMPMEWKERSKAFGRMLSYRLERWPDVDIWHRLTLTVVGSPIWAHDNNLTDFEAGCTLAEFAEKWLAARLVDVRIVGAGLTTAEERMREVVHFPGGARPMGWLCTDGKFHYTPEFMREGVGTFTVRLFTTRHEALLEAMMAFLKRAEVIPALPAPYKGNGCRCLDCEHNENWDPCSPANCDGPVTDCETPSSETAEGDHE